MTSKDVIIVAIASVLMASAGASSGAPQSIDAGTLQMTGRAIDLASIDAGTVRMTGLSVDPMTIDAGGLQMTGKQ